MRIPAPVPATTVPTAPSAPAQVPGAIACPEPPAGRLPTATPAWRRPLLWAGAAAGAGACGLLAGHGAGFETMGFAVQIGVFAAGALMAATGAASVVRSAYGFVLGLDDERFHRDLARFDRIHALHNIERDFDAILARLMLADARHHEKTLALYREAYEEIGKTLGAQLEQLRGRLQSESDDIAEYLAAYGLPLTVPAAPDDPETFARFFAALHEIRLGILSDDYARLLQKRDLFAEIREQIIATEGQIGELRDIIEVEFPKTAEHSAASLLEYRNMAAQAERRLAISRKLHAGDSAVEAELEYARAVSDIAGRFIASFQILQDEIQNRIAAAAVAEHPEWDGKVGRDAPTVTARAKGTSAADDPRERALRALRAQEAQGGRR